VEKMIEHKK